MKYTDIGMPKRGSEEGTGQEEMCQHCAGTGKKPAKKDPKVAAIWVGNPGNDIEDDEDDGKAK